MKNQIKKIELLVPAGNLEKLEIAIHYGADAVYLSGKKFNLRNFSDNFSLEEMYEARKLTLKYNIKMYVAVNVYSRDTEEKGIIEYLNALKEIEPDAVIVADPAIFVHTKNLIPEIPVHISTQSNTTNTCTAQFWKKLGAKRVNVARELTLKEITIMVEKSNIEIETFVHGSMCIAYSGRCLLSSFMTKRESNKGMCCQPCRFNYSVLEAKRPGEYFPVYEDESGSYIFSSKDLCMIDYIPDLINAGITSLKIEGRMKSINYLAMTTKVYRKAIDTYYDGNNLIQLLKLKYWHEQLARISNRGYCTGFFFGNSEQVDFNSNESNSTYIFAAKVLEETFKDRTLVNVRNKLLTGDKVKIISPSSRSEKHHIIQNIVNQEGSELNFAQPNTNVHIKMDNIVCNSLDLIQKIK